MSCHRMQASLLRGIVHWRAQNLLPKTAKAVFREALNHSARAGSERFFPSRRFRKRWNPVWISRFLNRTDGGKDPLPSRSRIIQRFPNRLPSGAQHFGKRLEYHKRRNSRSALSKHCPAGKEMESIISREGAALLLPFFAAVYPHINNMPG